MKNFKIMMWFHITQYVDWSSGTRIFPSGAQTFSMKAQIYLAPMNTWKF